MTNTKHRWVALCMLLGTLAAGGSRAQVTFSEDFTGTTTTTPGGWYYFGGACLTAGTSTSTANPGPVPACTAVLSSYYHLQENADPYLMGGYLGYLGSSTAPSSVSAQVADPVITTNGVAVGYGALRFTNGSMNINGSEQYGHGERGAILSSTTMPTSAGIQITFKTITYHGDSGGQDGASDGADGISFFLQDGSQAPGLGAWGGSLAYSCSNTNIPYDGLVGAYLGLGVDEYGNFLNGTNLMPGYTGSNTPSGDNTAYGYGVKPGRIGLRGAGNVSWASLNGAYGGDPSNSARPYYPTSLATSCIIGGGTYSAATQSCIDICSTTGSFYDSTTGLCNNACPTGAAYDSTTNTCNSCTSGTYNPTTTMCVNTNQCATGTYYAGTATCDSCPATGYVGGNYSNGTCTNSCPTGYTLSGTLCYPAGDSASGTYYCPSGEKISGTSCYPNTATAETGTYYCTASGSSISGSYCYPTGNPANVYGAGYYCPSGDTAPTSAGKCCPSGYTYNTTSKTCKDGSKSSAASAATVATPATAMSAATAMTPAQTVTAAQTATLNTTPAQSAPSTYGAGTGNVDAQYAVQNTCATGNLYNYSSASSPTSAGSAVLSSSNPANTANILDYAPIPNAYKELTSFQIANESAVTRAAATPIFYNLQITQDGLLSFSYSVSGGAYSYLIKNQSITASNGPLPATFRVGFAGSDGGASNIHEIMCFKASTFKESGSSATANEKESAKVETGTQAYFAYYDPTDWTGTVTANALISSGSVVTVSSTANWDASCLLNGTSGGCTNTGTTSASSATPAPGDRVMLTWDTANNHGIPFEWTSLNGAQQAALDFGDATTTSNRLSYLRGDRTNEINSSNVGLYRARDSILGDIVDSSPIWMGPPSSPYTATWSDLLYGGAMPENGSTAQSYLQFSQAEQTRLNVVYVGANDGFLHGFRAGSFDANGNFVNNGTTPNDGQEVLAYMPGSTLVSAALGSATGGCTNDANTQTLVQGIHGVTPAVGANAECTEPVLDYANTQYGHNFFVDATPGSGDLFYGGVWHTWLVSGLGAGGQAIFALDITNPTGLATPTSGSDNVPFSEGNASSIVIGEWNSATITCTNVPSCGNSLGNTFGTPQIRRLHNGNWGVIFGNGFGSAAGDAGIYIMSVDSSGNRTFYYLTTGVSGANGIAYVTPADLDGDHITDYVYAGDLHGNVWRFDLTSNNPSSWSVASAPLFTTQFQTTSIATNAATASGNVLLFAAVSGVCVGQAVSGTGIAAGTYVQSVVGATVVLSQSVSGAVASGTTITFSGHQPITSQLLLVSTTLTGGAPRILLEFGTGQRTQLTNLAPVQYASGVQSLYGVWDWNFAAWNTLAPGAPHQSLAATATGLASPYTLTYSNLAAQTLTVNSNGTVDGTNVPVCWPGSTTCTGNQFGWYANLPSSGEQIIYNPVFSQGSIQVNSVVPANNVATSCSSNLDTGYTYVLNVINGGIFGNTFPTYTAPNSSTVITDSNEAAVETNAAGSVYNVISNGGTTSYIVYQTISGVPGTQQVKIPSNIKSKRLTWIEQR